MKQLRSTEAGPKALRPLPFANRRGTEKARGGFTIVEMLMVIAIIMIMGAIALPYLYGNRRSYHLSQAATAVTGAMQATRYQAIMTGCPYSITFTTTNTNYQVQSQALTGTPPACAGAFTNVGGAIPWSTAGDVSMSPNTTLQFSPAGIVTATTGSTTFTLSNGFTTNTISISGAGNVKVTMP
jgi:type II secretion system protein H